MIAKRLWILLPLGMILSIQTWLLNLHYPLIGSDLELYFARLIDVYLHMKIDGIFSVQWWTPTFGGGIPAYPNPLHLQFSVTPYLMFFFTPWVAVQFTYAIFATIGYFLIYNYIHNHTKWGFHVAICSACIFTTNGYFLNHILVGHVNYCSFTIIALVPYIISSSWSQKRCILVFSLCITYLVYSAGFPTVYLIYISFGHLFLFLPLIKREPYQFRKVFTVLLISHLIILCLVCSKFTAVTLHMDVFPRIKEYFSWQPYYQVILVSSFAQLFAWRILIPFEFMLPIPADSILFWLIGSRYEFWENDVSLSPVVPVVIFVFSLLRLSEIKRFLKIPTNQTAVIFILISLWCSIEMTMGKGLFWTIVKDLPVIKSTHVNVRYAGALILLFSLLFAFCFSKLTSKTNSRLKIGFSLIIISTTFASMVSYHSIIDQKESYRNYHAHNAESTWSSVSSNTMTNRISTIMDVSPKAQMILFENNATSLMPLDPLYGYHGEYFQSSLSLGPIEKIDEDGFYNFHNPITFYNPAKASLPREKIHSNDQENFYLFINRKQPSWELPFIQKVANYITLASMILYFLYICNLILIKNKVIKS